MTYKKLLRIIKFQKCFVWIHLKPSKLADSKGQTSIAASNSQSTNAEIAQPLIIAWTLHKLMIISITLLALKDTLLLGSSTWTLASTPSINSPKLNTYKVTYGSLSLPTKEPKLLSKLAIMKSPLTKVSCPMKFHKF